MNQSSARLACYELWGGNGAANHPVELPGLVGWVFAAPLGPASSGGDVHYFSVCNKGMVSRIVVADVAGHGHSASSVALKLRHALERHADHWDQSALMQELNEAFLVASVNGQYATAIVISFYAQTGELLFTTAGHPPPLWYRSREKSWELLQDSTPFAVEIEALPLGLIPGTLYAQTGVRLGFGDILVLYTDGIIEARDPSGRQLGCAGLLERAWMLPAKAPADVGQALILLVDTFRAGRPSNDDETLVVLQREADRAG
jgi:serine phosphatase RsbU (regulator of sigma subunit)